MCLEGIHCRVESMVSVEVNRIFFTQLKACWRTVSLGLSEGKGGRQGETDESFCKSRTM